MINWIILGVIAYFLLKIFWGLFLTLLVYVFPPKPTPPDHRFGKLPALVFPAVEKPVTSITFTLETIEGTVPNASSSALVYFMPKDSPNIMALPNTQDFARRLQFKTDPIPETKNVYRFEDTEYPQRTMRYDIVSNNFIVRYAYETDLGVFGENDIPGFEAAKSEARNILQTLNIMKNDILKGETKVTYMRLVSDTLVPTTSQSQANAVRIDFFRQPVNGIMAVTPDPTRASISVLLSGSRNQKKRILELAYTYWPVDYQTIASYSIIPSTDAWGRLQSGQGYIPKYPLDPSVIIRKVYLGYYDAYEPQLYLQPVYVFEGDNGFKAYVPAIAVPWTE